MPQVNDFWRILREEIMEVDWHWHQAAKDSFVGNVTAFLEAKIQRGLVLSELPGAEKAEFMKELKNFLTVGAESWGKAGRAEHQEFFEKMAEELEEIAKQAKWFDKNLVIWAN